MSGGAYSLWSLRAVALGCVSLGILAPVAAGMWQTVRAAFGSLPAIGAFGPDAGPWADLLAMPGLLAAVRLTIVTGLGATVLSLMVAIGVCAALHGRRSPRLAARVLVPFLAMPHAALAIGLAFVLAPSGWIGRAMAPWLGWDRPPDLATVNDPWGLALILGLMIKEVPFLLFVLLSALTQIPVRQQMAAGRALGYGRGMVWIKVILPQLWPLIRLPVMIVLAYGMSVVDMALILGPSNPPTLAVMLTRLFSNPDLRLLLPASAGGLLQLGLVIAAFALVWLVQRGLRVLGGCWVRRGRRGGWTEPGLALTVVVLSGLVVLGGLAMSAMLVWSFAWRWPWPALVPDSWSLRAWMAPAGGWGRALGHTVVIALCSAGLSLLLAIAWLEGEDRARRGRARWAEVLVHVPLLVPQVSFLFGMNILLLRLGLSGSLLAVIWAHSLFVFPYVMLALAAPWRALDPRLGRTAAALGAGPWRRLIGIKLPVLLAPVCAAAAIGVAVSVAQYLPTLFIGAGRVPTLTTEAVTLAASSDRRVTGVYASLQAALPFLAYLLAFALPAIVHRNRRDLRGQVPE
ncbi:putative thiamine transport system permease protein [Gemmobacter megaterium]|uniref:Putative thiamine transport system permease protein n=1 Tax=Gemmobacter megaterium TaxID=1086013 RepID=A0A1N7N9Q0_9RHOB|nr:ABC transporter permease [Gemmobacter megaterium]GGE13825.1 ABC transporter permease [Gemmobacter megaterium]SIS95103.1 putative thiamine transport system permease protein [Gemmobacter megaterium]